jgi:hydroxymethylglutaryl-CoA lyase
LQKNSFVCTIKNQQVNYVSFLGSSSYEGVSHPVLCPNLKGYESAVKCGVEEVAVFLTASETFSRKNTNCSVETSLQRASEILERAKQDGIKVRGYVSCVVGCPYEGFVPPEATAKVSSSTFLKFTKMYIGVLLNFSLSQQIAKQLYDMGCHEMSLGDTIGVGTPETLVYHW